MTLHSFRPGARRGNYSGMLIFSLPAVIGAGAVVVDLSTQKVVRAQLQAVADISAMAGTEALDGTNEGLERARARAGRAAARNEVNGRTVSVSAEDLLTGVWDPEREEFVDDVPAEDVDTMQVSVGDSDIATTLARLAFQVDSMSARGASTGFRPPDEAASAIGCYLPIGIPSCLFDAYSEEQINGLTLVINPPQVDSMGWARVGAHPNANFVKNQLEDCEQDGVIEVGDEVGLMNGVVTSALQALDTQIVASDTVWDGEWGPQPARMSGSSLSASEYGRTLEGAIIVFDGGDGYCEGSGGQFNGYQPLVGFAWVAIYDVRSSGSSSQKNIKMKIDTYVDRSVGLRGGGGIFAGVTWQAPPMLIR